MRATCLIVVMVGCGDSLHPAADAAPGDGGIADAVDATPDASPDAAPSSLTITPSPIEFGAVTSGAMQLVTSTNASSADIKLYGVSLASAAFSISTSSCTPETVLAAGKSCALRIVATDLGAISSQLVVSSAAGNPTAPVSASVSGTVTVTPSGPSTGRITSNPAGIDCGATCSATFSAPVTLTATPAAGATFYRWTTRVAAGRRPARSHDPRV